MSNGNHWIDLDYTDGPEGEIDYDDYDPAIEETWHEDEFDLDPETEFQLQERFEL